MGEDVSGTSDSGCGQARHTPRLWGDMWPQTSEMCPSSLPFGLLLVLTLSLDKPAEPPRGTEQPLSSAPIKEGSSRCTVHSHPF